jgi:hypothetical protein
MPVRAYYRKDLALRNWKRPYISILRIRTLPRQWKDFKTNYASLIKPIDLITPCSPCLRERILIYNSLRFAASLRPCERSWFNEKPS